MARTGLDRESVLDAATRLADKHGMTGLTMSNLAAKLNIRPPSLYNHFDSLKSVEDGLTLRGLEGMLAASRDAAMGLSAWPAVEALARAHRRFALKNPGLYAATLRHAEDRNQEIRTAAKKYLQLVLAALRGFELKDDSDLHVARAFHAALRGFVSLELGHGFGLAINVEESFDVLLGILRLGIAGRR